MKDKIAIIVVTYNRLELLKSCIAALQYQSYPNTEIIVVNNGSTDGTYEWLESHISIEKIHQHNSGSAGGFYAGVKFATEKKYSYIWVMDDDVVPESDALEYLLEARNIVGDFAFLCSKVVSKDDVFINAPNIDLRPSQYNYPQWGQFSEEGIIRIKNATFVSLFINTTYLLEAGLPNRSFFIWGDDIDFTSRLSKIAPGYMVGKSKVVHLRADPSFPSILTEKDNRRIALHYYNVRNNLYISRKHKKFTECILDMLRVIKITFACLFVQNGWHKASIYIKGFWAGLFFNPSIIYPNLRK